jgi:hypothetical protein
VKRDRPHHFENEAHSKLREEVEAAQRNIVWPDAMCNAISVDALLWRGSSEATTVQRVGIAVWGLSFLSIGLFFVFSLATEVHSVLIAVLGVLASGLGVRVTLNAFRRKPKLSRNGERKR